MKNDLHYWQLTCILFGQEDTFMDVLDYRQLKKEYRRKREVDLIRERKEKTKEQDDFKKKDKWLTLLPHHNQS